MADYFTSVGTKSSLKSEDIFSNDDCKPELLLDYYDKQPKLIDSEPGEVERLFKEWCQLLSVGRNVVVSGPQSKFRLLEHFNTTYLQSGFIGKYSFDNLHVITMHGFTPITIEEFTHAMFKKTDCSKLQQEEITQYLGQAKKTDTHQVFILHSFELLFKECRKIIDLIISMYETEPDLIHIVMSVDHINCGKVLTNAMRQRLKLTFFMVPYGESFLHEKLQSIGIMDDGKDSGSKIFDSQLDLRSIQDIYKALQKNCQEVLLYIVKAGSEKSMATINFEQLMNYCQSKFLARRAAILRTYLAEMEDHRMVKLDESGSKIQCLISIETCKKFLQVIDQ